MNPNIHLRPKKAVKYDLAYDGYAQAINTTPMLKNPSSMRRLPAQSGVGIADSMRYIAKRVGDIRKIRQEEERIASERRLAELE
jgi:hypothetical protein